MSDENKQNSAQGQASAHKVRPHHPTAITITRAEDLIERSVPTIVPGRYLLVAPNAACIVGNVKFTWLQFAFVPARICTPVLRVCIPGYRGSTLLLAAVRTSGVDTRYNCTATGNRLPVPSARARFAEIQLSY